MITKIILKKEKNHEKNIMMIMNGEVAVSKCDSANSGRYNNDGIDSVVLLILRGWEYGKGATAAGWGVKSQWWLLQKESGWEEKNSKK